LNQTEYKTKLSENQKFTQKLQEKMIRYKENSLKNERIVIQLRQETAKMKEIKEQLSEVKRNC